MHRYVCGLVLVGLVGCRPSRESISAGQIGCAPSDITISDEDSSVGWSQSSETWVAECDGRSFICSKLNTAGEKGLSDSDVTCREELSGRDEVANKAQPAPAPPKPKTDGPSGGAGFVLGDEPAQAQKACEDAGNTWDGSRANQGVCSGPAQDLGFAADVTVDFCKQRTCAITIRHRPEAAWSSALTDLRQTLVAKYGPPTETVASIPGDCRSEAQLAACLEKDLRLRFTWTWDSGERLNLLAGKPERGDGDAAIRIQYVKAVSSVRADPSAL